MEVPKSKENESHENLMKSHDNLMKWDLNPMTM